VLLIDDLDKSDIDLPNDLLNVLEEGELAIPELEHVADQLLNSSYLTDAAAPPSRDRLVDLLIQRLDNPK
jgi:MoxR-like ATPase